VPTGFPVAGSTDWNVSPSTIVTLVTLPAGSGQSFGRTAERV
jgi:hypothetical protein